MDLQSIQNSIKFHVQHQSPKIYKISRIFSRHLNKISINFQSIQFLKFTQYPRIIQMHSSIIIWQAGRNICSFCAFVCLYFLATFAYVWECLALCFSRYRLLFTAISIFCLDKLNMFELHRDISISLTFTNIDCQASAT